MKKRNPYKTAQQEAMLQYFLEDKHNFLTVKDLLSSLQKLQIDIGQTTVYRFLERQALEGSVSRAITDCSAKYTYQKRRGWIGIRKWK